MAFQSTDSDGDEPSPGMILIMGVTGSGKSHFINTLVKDAVREDKGLISCTSECQIVQAKIGEEKTIAIVDTPGFDDTTRSDTEILSEITRFLTSQYQLGIPLKGIIYLHRIIDQKMQGSALRNFRIFQELCGEEALPNVILLTTMWDKLPNRLEGLDRDQQLRTSFWSMMESRGSYIASFDGSKEMAEAMVTMLAAKQDVVLHVQKELHEQRKSLGETSAGQLLVPVLQKRLDNNNDETKWLRVKMDEAERQKDRAEAVRLAVYRQRLQEERDRHRREIASLRVQIAQETEERIAQQNKTGRWKSTLNVFANVTGLAVTVVFNLLPIFGISI